MKPIPPLLMLAEGRRPRMRRSPLANPREDVLHKAVVDLLRKLARPDWRWSHFPSGEKRDIRTAARLKALGLQPGWPDLQLLSPAGRYHGLELKRVGAELSEPQEAFRIWCLAHGVPHAKAETLDEVLQILGVWGCLLPIGGAE